MITDPPHDTLWGGDAGSFQDPNGHLWKVAWNPHIVVLEKRLMVQSRIPVRPPNLRGLTASYPTEYSHDQNSGHAKP